MGECGCGDREPDYWMPGPEGFFYTVVVFAQVCRSCGAQPGIAIDMWPESDARMREGVTELYRGRHRLGHVYIEMPRTRPPQEKP